MTPAGSARMKPSKGRTGMSRRGNKANAQPVPAQQSYDQDPKAPAGLGPKASPDQRFELCYGPPVAEGVRVLTEYFVALSVSSHRFNQSAGLGGNRHGAINRRWHNFLYQ